MADWVDDVHIRIDVLADILDEEAHLTFSAESLAEVEAAAMARFTGELPQPFLDNAAAYVGEMLLQAAGGSWSEDEPPVVRADEALSLGEVSPWELLYSAAQHRTGEVTSTYRMWKAAADQYAHDHPGWEPAKTPTPGLDITWPEPTEFLKCWLAERTRAFPDWVARFGADGTWDFSPASIGTLTDAVLRNTPTVDSFHAPDNAEFVDGAAWYWGEVLRRATHGTWGHEPGERNDRSPTTGYCWVRKPRSTVPHTPELGLVYMVELGDRDLLRRLFDDWTR
ncbi:hypothetical protein [Nocardia abscessus]|uniref:hypothetical protein n=1 Tax=Nocardia abscessus TaxID=120957 RepID=UPI002453E1C8|nr:hypothetical protein [Nocardia abscessus]